MLGDEALNIDYGGVFKPESTENAESEMSVYKALMMLDDTLAVYPEGFFDKFYEEGMNGMSFGIRPKTRYCKKTRQRLMIISGMS